MRTFKAPEPVFAGNPNKSAFEAQQANRTAHQNMLKKGGRRKSRRSRRARRTRRWRGGEAVAVPQFNNASANDLVVQAANHQMKIDNLNSALSNTGQPKTGGRRKYFLRR